VVIPADMPLVAESAAEWEGLHAKHIGNYAK